MAEAAHAAADLVVAVVDAEAVAEEQEAVDVVADKSVDCVS